jgi:hypothetical protein
VFQAQFRLMIVTSQLEAAEAQLEEAVEVGRRLRAWRLRRVVERLWDAVEAERRLLAPPPWRQAEPWIPQPGLGAPELLHSRLRPYVVFDPESRQRELPYGDELAAARLGLAGLATVGSLTAIAVSAAEIAARGISDRPSLVVAELCAIVLSPAAIALTAADKTHLEDTQGARQPGRGGGTGIRLPWRT